MAFANLKLLYFLNLRMQILDTITELGTFCKNFYRQNYQGLIAVVRRDVHGLTLRQNYRYIVLSASVKCGFHKRFGFDL